MLSQKIILQEYLDFDKNPIDPYLQMDAQEFLTGVLEKIESALKDTPEASLVKVGGLDP